MSTQKEEGISAQPSEVAQFYDGKSIFITGAAGFLGSVLLEILLRCCPGICRIYILLRSKKGVKPEDRKQTIFQKEIFAKLLEKNPGVQDKVIVVSGDITQENLGLNHVVLLTVTQEVSIIFHCAAEISFNRPLSFMINQNVIGLNNVIEFSRKLKKLEVLVYTSSAYTNSHLKPDIIEEKVYKLPVTAEEAIEATRNGNEGELRRLMSKCYPPFVNNYTFSKGLAENLISEKAKDLPVCMVRPSLVIFCLRGPLPGYVENGSGLVSFYLGFGKGFFRVVPVDVDKKVDHIPADTVANTLVIAAYRQVSERLPSSYIYHCTAGELAPFTWGEVLRTFNSFIKHPLPSSYQTPALRLVKCPIKYSLFSMIDHYAPAIVIDFLLWITGRKPRLVKLYRLYDKAMTKAEPFMMNGWDFKCENFKSLMKNLNATDSQLFPVNLRDFTVEKIAECMFTGAPFYTKDKGKESIAERKWIIYLRFFFISSIKWCVLGGIASVLYIAIF